MHTIYGCGQRLREVRKQRGLKISELATKVGIHYSHLSKIEANKTGVREHVLRSCAAGLGVNYEWLETGNGVPGYRSENGDLGSYDTRGGREGVVNDSPGGKSTAQSREIDGMARYDLEWLLQATRRVVTSQNPIIREALIQNIVAFDYALESDKKLLETYKPSDTEDTVQDPLQPPGAIKR